MVKRWNKVREELLASDQYQELTAVKDHAVYAVPPRLLLGYGAAEGAFGDAYGKNPSPEEFADLDMVKEVQEFYETFTIIR